MILTLLMTAEEQEEEEYLFANWITHTSN